MADPGNDPFERIRSHLRRVVPAGWRVSDGLESHVLTDGAEATADVLVSDDLGGLRLVILPGPMPPVVSGFWLTYGQVHEVWLVDEAARQIEQVRAGGQGCETGVTGLDGILRSDAVPALTLSVAEVFAAAPPAR